MQRLVMPPQVMPAVPDPWFLGVSSGLQEELGSQCNQAANDTIHSMLWTCTRSWLWLPALTFTECKIHREFCAKLQDTEDNLWISWNGMVRHFHNTNISTWKCEVKNILGYITLRHKPCRRGGNTWRFRGAQPPSSKSPQAYCQSSYSGGDGVPKLIHPADIWLFSEKLTLCYTRVATSLCMLRIRGQR